MAAPTVLTYSKGLCAGDKGRLHTSPAGCNIASQQERLGGLLENQQINSTDFSTARTMPNGKPEPAGRTYEECSERYFLEAWVKENRIKLFRNGIDVHPYKSSDAVILAAKAKLAAIAAANKPPPPPPTEQPKG